jgi:pimeloyl-ACP methyl ester carboxylesterase
MQSALPEIVLLPGLDGTGDLFNRLVPKLSPALNVTVIRYPNDPTLGYPGYVDFVRRKIGSRKVLLLGESFSGPVAIRLAARLGKQVSGLVLAATFVRSPWPGFLIRRAAHIEPTQTPSKLRDAILMGPYGDAALVAQVDKIVHNLSRPVRAARLRAVAGVNVACDFEELKCPVLVLHGRGDWLVRKSQMQKAITRRGRGRLVVLPGAHMLLQTRAAEAAAEIIHFMKSTAEARYET